VRIFYPELDRDRVLERLRSRLALIDARLPLLRAVLFGSYARGDHTVSSDVDLLLVYRGGPCPEAYNLAWRLLDLRKLELHIYAETEYPAFAETLERMTRDGVVLLFRG